MTAASLTGEREARQGLREIDPARDLVHVAELIEQVFAGQMDAAGRRMVREMRAFGRVGGLGALLARLLLPPAASNPLGYVWQERGRVVGNASLLRVEGHPDRWVLANVAVHPDYRRRGIGRALTAGCLKLASERGAAQVILQVDSENQHAQVMYATMGFRTLTTRTTWRGHLRNRPGELTSGGEARRRAAGEWRHQWELAQRLHPEGLVWPYPLQVGLFEPNPIRALFGLDRARHWLWDHDGELAGSLTLRHPGGRGMQLLLMVEPAWRGQLEVPLLASAAAALGRGRYAATMDYPAGVAVETLERVGFQPRRTLTWMRKEIG